MPGCACCAIRADTGSGSTMVMLARPAMPSGIASANRPVPAAGSSTLPAENPAMAR
ncbi:hypothetical protein GPA_18710 [Gordonibacter pamelaeae 7-10-1-b]|uniref:Uncharacterized protein n=1 Tax=Gordonibacter pamelaeae 7-10-1-b TaxID=657308 RepID=D6E990_9ACTN|nr:hypothetical protein GPA_18710 [Gordonibacter pamelaeae 7-10-1-b]